MPLESHAQKRGCSSTMKLGRCEILQKARAAKNLREEAAVGPGPSMSTGAMTLPTQTVQHEVSSLPQISYLGC